MDDIIQEKINLATQKILAQKQDVIVEAILNKVGIEFDIVAESKRTFPRVASKILHNGHEQWYWDDGSEEGLRLVTFYNLSDNVPTYNPEDRTYKMIFRLDYY